MKQFAKYFALVMLIVLILPSILFLADKMTLDTVKTVMMVATILWFISASLWMWKSDA